MAGEGSPLKGLKGDPGRRVSSSCVSLTQTVDPAAVRLGQGRNQAQLTTHGNSVTV